MNDPKIESSSGDFCIKPSRGGGETYQFLPKLEPYKQYKIGDFEHTHRNYKFIDVIFDPVIGDSKPPERILATLSTRTPQQMTAELERKLQQNSIRRQIHINNIIQRSRQQNEKGLKIREKMAAKRAKEALEIEAELQKRRTEAEKTRFEILNEKVDKFRKEIEHAETVKNRKITSTAKEKNESKDFNTSRIEQLFKKMSQKS